MYFTTLGNDSEFVEDLDKANSPDADAKQDLSDRIADKFEYEVDKMLNESTRMEEILKEREALSWD